MPDDTLSAYAQSQPDKPGVIDDRPDGTVVTWTYAELEAQSNTKSPRRSPRLR